MIFFSIVALTCTPFSESRNVMYEFLCFQKIEYSIHSDCIDRELVWNLIRSERIVIIFEEGENLLSGFCLPHKCDYNHIFLYAILLH